MPHKALAAVLAAVLVAPAYADPISVEDAYFRYSGSKARAGAAFMEIVNSGETGDRLVAARSDVAGRVELHAHEEDGNGVMRMIEAEEGFAVPAAGRLRLRRGGNHIMFMGLARHPGQGEVVTVTLVFERAGEIVVEIPADLER